MLPVLLAGFEGRQLSDQRTVEIIASKYEISVESQARPEIVEGFTLWKLSVDESGSRKA